MDSTQTVSESAVRAARELRVLISRLRRRFLEASDSHELTPSQMSVLSRLKKRGDSTASDLATAERVRPQAVAATLAVLDERGFVERHTDPADRRRQVVSLTRAGRDLLDDRGQAGQEWLSAALQEHFTEAERATVLDALAILERLTSE